MVEFKIGDRVRAVVADSLGWEVGYETVIVRGDMSHLGVIDRGGVNRYFDNTEWELDEPANDELAELRAFKEAAIKRFPELAPVDPDLLEAHEVAEKFAWPRTDPQSSMWEGSASQMALAAIKRGRELERYAQGLTTPKD